MNRADFPVLHQEIYHRPLVYFDNAATVQKPLVVIDALSNYYKTINSNIHRGVHYLSQKATDEFEQARQTVQQFINARYAHEIIFTRGTTESINLIANVLGKFCIKEEDEIILSEMEHHANIVPWQMVCEERHAKLKILPFDEDGVLKINHFKSLISSKTKLVSLTHVSNTLGSINDVKKIIEISHNQSIPVMIDGAQAISHCLVDVQDLDCDFYCFSGHKMYAPMGIGVMYAKESWLNILPPYQGGGEMIEEVSFEKTTYNKPPFKFEAGTPSVGDAIGLRKAIEYIEGIGIQIIAKHEQELLNYATDQLKRIDGITIYGNAPQKTSIISFNINKLHPYDVGTIIDKMGIAVRTGHHCTQPIMNRFGIPGTVRASFALYNEEYEIDRLIEAVKIAKKMLE